jgi:calpain-9
MRRDGTMRLADFVSAILHLTMAFELFKAKDSNQDNQIKMGLNEVSWTMVLNGAHSV